MADTARKPGRVMRIVLAISLTLNLLVVGMVAGVFWRHGHPRDHRPPPLLAVTLFRALPEADRTSLRDALHDRRDGGDARRADLAAVAEALRARPFDRAAFETLLLRHEEVRAERQDAMRAAFLSRIAAMDDQERSDYADRVERFGFSKGRRPSRE